MRRRRIYFTRLESDPLKGAIAGCIWAWAAGLRACGVVVLDVRCMKEAGICEIVEFPCARRWSILERPGAEFLVIRPWQRR